MGEERRGQSEEEAEVGAGWPEEQAGEEVKLIILSFFRYHEQKMPGWPHDKKKLSIRALAQKHGVPYTSLQKRIAGTVTKMAPSSGGAKATPTYWPNQLKVNLNSSHYLLTFSNIWL